MVNAELMGLRWRRLSSKILVSGRTGSGCGSGTFLLAIDELINCLPIRQLSSRMYENDYFAGVQSEEETA